MPPVQVYDFAITPNGAGIPGANGASVVFRFMPDAREVQSALEVRSGTARLTVAGTCGHAAEVSAADLVNLLAAACAS